MSITYTITTDFGAKDSLQSGDAQKVIRGSEFTTEFSAIKSAFALAAPAASPTFTGTVTIPTLTLGATTITATGAEINYIDGVTSNVQTQLNAKAPIASPTFTGTTTVPAVVFNGSVEEQVYALSGTEIDPANGTIQTKTLAANTTFTEVLTDGEYVILMIDDGTGYTITWPTVSWVGGFAPTLETSGYNVISLWKVGSTLYGVTSGAA